MLLVGRSQVLCERNGHARNFVQQAVEFSEARTVYVAQVKGDVEMRLSFGYRAVRDIQETRKLFVRASAMTFRNISHD